jgi:type I restriction enzyme R subunit
VNDSAVKVIGDETLRQIAQELVKIVKGSLTIDWTVRENVRADACHHQADSPQARVSAG